jgi:hypothetical protein
MQQGHVRLEETDQMGAIAIEASGQEAVTSPRAMAASEPRQAGIAPSSPPCPGTHLSADLPFAAQSGPGWDTRPDKFALETRIIELGATLSAAQQMFKLLERDFYLAAFGRYDE